MGSLHRTVVVLGVLVSAGGAAACAAIEADDGTGAVSGQPVAGAELAEPSRSGDDADARARGRRCKRPVGATTSSDDGAASATPPPEDAGLHDGGPIGDAAAPPTSDEDASLDAEPECDDDEDGTADAQADASLPPPDVDAGAPADGGVVAPPPSLRLLQALTLEGCFLTSGAIAADASFVYLASGCTQTLFIVSRGAGFAVETVALPASADSVTVDASSIYVGLATGDVLAMAKSAPHASVTHPVGERFATLSARESQMYASSSQSRMAVTSSRVFFAPLNIGDVAREVNPRSWATVREYPAGVPGVTSAFDRVTGTFVGNVPNPLDRNGQPLGVALRADESFFYQTMPGCCGVDVVVYDSATLVPAGRIARANVNDVMRSGRWLFGGSEAGEVLAWDFQSPSLAALVSSIDLRVVTRHFGSEDIEIRAIWADEHDGLVFAASSWGNDLSRGPSLPSFFVLGQ
jgi:hypothetical protein